MKGKAPRRRPLYPSMSPNGRLVHLSDKDGVTMCSSATIARCRVRSRITCRRCQLARPSQATRHAHKRRATGIDWTPFYNAVRRALDGGGSEPRQTFKAIYARG